MPVAEGRAAAADGALRNLTARELVTELARKASQLARKELALAKSEAREDLRTEIRVASGLGVAGVCALCVLNLLLVAAALALAEAQIMTGWQAALAVAAVVLVIGAVAGLVGWRRRVTRPLDTTRRSVQESVRWAKERFA
jgi:hypothetical protein